MAIHTEHPWVAEVSTPTDLHIATLACGWTLGFLCLTATKAWSQTNKISVYTVLIWGEQLSCLVFALLAWLYMIDKIQHSLALFVSLLVMWCIQTQFLLQIIINRVNLLWADRRRQNWLKYGVAFLVSLINISVFCIWVPARLQVSDRYVAINQIWDRVEKCIYLVIDAGLNWLFIRVVKERLVDRGLDRYRPLVRQNQQLIFVSISCDILIIGMMSLPNSFVYTAFHPVAYLIKVYIEMCLGALIVEISTAKPQRATPEKGFRGLQIAVETHTTTVAHHFDDNNDEEANLDSAPRTRTPARPDLHLRLEKMRKDRRERREAEEQGGSFERRGSDFSLSEEKIEMDSWESNVEHLPKANNGGRVREVDSIREK